MMVLRGVLAPKALARSALEAVCPLLTLRKTEGIWSTLSRSVSVPERYSRVLFL